MKKKEKTDISVVVGDYQEFCEVTDEEMEDEFLEEQQNDVLEEGFSETRQRQTDLRLQLQLMQPARMTFRPRISSTRHRSRTPEPGAIRSKNKMAREVLADAHASDRRARVQEFYHGPNDVTCVNCQDTAPIFCRGCGNSWRTECYMDR